MENFLEIRNLSKQYEEFSLHDINFCVPKGYIMGLIGPNGSGKTTTIKLILNMRKRSSGDIKIFGLDNTKNDTTIKKQLGVVFDSNSFVDEWTMIDVEKTIGRFYETWDKDKFYSMLEKFMISKKKRVKELSKGMQMKLMLACAFSYGAKLLILDEPTSGLDPVSRDELMDILREYIADGEHSVLFSTHITTDLEKVADYITYINFGKLFFTGSKDDFIDSFRIVRGGTNDLNAELEHKLIGLRKFSTGFEALIRTEHIEKSSKLTYELATIDDIIVYTSKRGNEYV